MTPIGSQPRPTRLNLLVRSALTSLALLLLALPALAVLGGYLPRLPFVSGFGRLLVTDLPWLLLGALISLLLAVAAFRLGGKRFTALLAAAALAVLLGGLIVLAQFYALAASHGASYDLFRQASSAPPPSRGADERVTFAEVSGQALEADVWRPRQPTGTAIGAGAGVLFIHGGSFIHGEPGLRPHLFDHLIGLGYTVVDVEYRLSPPPRWQDAPADVLCALGWFQSNAQSYGVDPARIVILGESAGGNLALMAAFAPGAETTAVVPSCDVAVAPAAGVIAAYPVADLTATWEDLRALGGESPFPELYTGGTPAQVPDRYAYGSVRRLIRSGLPPTLIYTGVNDQLIRIERMRELASEIRQAGSDVELIEVPFADHAFDGPTNGFGFQLLETLYADFLAEVVAPG